MLGDEGEHIRELDLRRILKCWNREVEVREFKVQKVYFGASGYTAD